MSETERGDNFRKLAGKEISWAKGYVEKIGRLREEFLSLRPQLERVLGSMEAPGKSDSGVLIDHLGETFFGIESRTRGEITEWVKARIASNLQAGITAQGGVSVSEELAAFIFNSKKTFRKEDLPLAQELVKSDVDGRTEKLRDLARERVKEVISDTAVHLEAGYAEEILDRMDKALRQFQSVDHMLIRAATAARNYFIDAERKADSIKQATQNAASDRVATVDDRTLHQRCQEELGNILKNGLIVNRPLKPISVGQLEAFRAYFFEDSSDIRVETAARRGRTLLRELHTAGLASEEIGKAERPDFESDVALQKRCQAELDKILGKEFAMPTPLDSNELGQLQAVYDSFFDNDGSLKSDAFYKRCSRGKKLLIELRRADLVSEELVGLTSVTANKKSPRE